MVVKRAVSRRAMNWAEPSLMPGCCWSPPEQPAMKRTRRQAGSILYMRWEFFANVLIRLEIDLMHLILLHQLLMDIVQDAIDKLSALRGAVILGQIDVFVDRHLGWNRFEVQELHYAHLHQDHVQGGDAFWVPVLELGPDQVHHRFFLPDDGLQEQPGELMLILADDLLEIQRARPGDIAHHQLTDHFPVVVPVGEEL